MRLAIPDMECDGCVAAITRAIRRHDAAAAITVDLAAHIADVTTMIEPARLVTLIEEAGYTVLDQNGMGS
jgi:copper chaperone